MSIVQFLRIFWARRLLILAATVSCLVGGILVGMILPPRWQAQSLVLLNLTQPDPVTGQVVTGGAYVTTQMELIKDYSVAGQVVDQLGWLSDPVLIEQYNARSRKDSRDFRRWIAQRIIDGTKTSIAGGVSDLLQIDYTASNPRDAKLVADALRKAYIDTSLALRRESASNNADWYAQQAQQAQAALAQATAAEADYERQSGIVLEDNKEDLDSTRLQALSAQAGVQAPPVMMASQASGLEVELAQTDASIAQEAKILGPNHPELQVLRAKRAALAKQITEEQAGAGAAAGAMRAGIGALDRAVSAQKARVISESDKIERLKQLQAAVELDRDLYTKTASRAADFRLDAGSATTGLTPLGNAVAPLSPIFPNWPLILLGSIVLGVGVGVLVALLTELFGRRVRGVEDLQSGLGVPLLAVVAGPAKGRMKLSLRRARALLGSSRRRRMAPA